MLGDLESFLYLVKFRHNNSKMGLMAQWDKWHSRSDGVNGRIRISQRHKPSSKYKGFMFVTLVGFYTNLCYLLFEVSIYIQKYLVSDNKYRLQIQNSKLD